MKIKLDEYDKVLSLISGLFRFEENEKFSQAALAVTEKELLLYDDHRPTDKNNGEYHYVVKKRYELKKIHFVLNERIKGSDDLVNYGHLYFYSKEVEYSFDFYYLISDQKKVKEFLKELKSLNVPNAKKSTKLNITKF